MSGMKVGKLVAIMAPSSIAHRLAGGEAHDQESHGDAVVEMGRDRAAAARRPCRSPHDEIVAVDGGGDSGGVQARRRPRRGDRIP